MKFRDYIKESSMQVGTVNKNVYVFDADDDKQGLLKLAKRVDKKAKISTGSDKASYIWFPTAHKAEEFFGKFREKFGRKL